MRHAKRNTEGAEFVLCDANALPFRNEVFDVVIAAQFLEHITNAAFAVSNLRSVVKNKGFIFFEVPSKSNLIDMLIRKLLRRESRWGLTIDPSHKRFFSQEQLRQLFKEHQLSLLKVYGVIHFRYNLPLIRKLVWDEKRRFWRQLDVLNSFLGAINEEWGSIQTYVVIKD